MATTTRVPLEVYLRNFDYEPDAEYVDGTIEERTVAEDIHSSWHAATLHWFGLNDAQWNILVRPSLRIQTSPTRIRVADVAILDAAVPTSPVAIHPPLAAFEVLSPEDRLPRLLRKLGDYANMGIPEIWVIDPETKSFSRYEAGNLTPRDHFSSGTIAFDTAEITRLVR